jgi:chemotaxis protein methyltransferase CheR
MDLMSDTHCTAFLQWALPQLGLRWPGFRKVRRQVCRRLKRRITELQLDDLAAYRARLEADPAEWRAFDECCHITISRFFRGKGVFEVLRRRVLPDLAARAKREGRDVHIWSAGCASGEEPYTLKILWDLEVAGSYPGVSLSIIATDVDRTMLARARNACFEQTSLRELPPYLVGQAFDPAANFFCVKPQHREGIEFLYQDLRSEAPARRFDLILCRYVAFTYFALPLQQEVLARLSERLLPNGDLVIGAHERLPVETPELAPLAGAPQIFEKHPTNVATLDRPAADGGPVR